jgi:hypothetical protein
LLEREPRFQPLVELLHDWSAVVLMKHEALGCRKMALARLRIIFIYVAQCFQNMAAWLREVRSDLYKLPSSVRQAVGQQDLRAIGEFGRIARQRITHLKGPGEICCAVFEHIAQILARVLAAGEV